MRLPDLPISKIIPDICAHLQTHNRLIIQAEPGAGKTTLFPLSLLSEAWTSGKKIIMLEPRRLAARSAAMHMAALLGEKVGETVGYRIQLESKVSAKTKLEIVTEGILTRRIQQDPELENICAIIFDEFHERSLQADLGLALSLDCQEGLREDLKIIVMSATLDGDKLSQLLDQAKIIQSTGRHFPVETHYLGPLPTLHNRRPDYATGMTNAIKKALQEETGSLLVFLPGEGEIKSVEKALSDAGLPQNCSIHPLYGALSITDQQRAINKPAKGQRKIVLATNIAETSLTIEGIRIVIDSGYQRVMRYDPNKCLNELETKSISLASAIQRQGRAGRMEAGICYKLWDKQAEGAMRAYDKPEILSADLTSFALELANWGITQIDQLKWLDLPTTALMDQAHDLLQMLGALDKNLRITNYGKFLLKFPTHPRLGHMILQAHHLNAGQQACDIAALLSEKDILMRSGQSNLELRLKELFKNKAPHIKRIKSLSERWFKQLEKSIPQLNDLITIKHDETLKIQRQIFNDYPDSQTGLLLAFAFPDRISKQRTRDDNKYVMANRRGVLLDQGDALFNAPIMVIADLYGMGTDSKIRLAAAIHITAFLNFFAPSLQQKQTATWHKKLKTIQKRKQTRLGRLIIKDSSSETAPQEEIVQALFQAIRTIGIDSLPWSKAALHFRQRVNAAAYWQKDAWPDMSAEYLLNHLEDWLAPFLTMNLDQVNHPNDLKMLDLHMILKNHLDWSQQQKLDLDFPELIQVPSGSKIHIDYSHPETPILPVKLQEMFGATETPTIFKGQIPLTLHLLSPARAPLQITRNLVTFWQEAYQHVKAEMRGQYPKHPWPDDPMSHIATAKTKRRLKQ